jgi:hypothetical protein
MTNKIVLLACFFICTFTYSKAQKIHAEPSDFKQLFSRPLIVELLEEDPKIIAHFEKNAKKHPNGLEDYKSFIALYNENIKMAVGKFWTANKDIEYRTTSDIHTLVKKKNTTYSVLYYSESAEQFVDYATNKNIVVPMLNYTRMEHHNGKVDYSIFLPISFLTPHDDYIETDLIFGVQFIQRNIEYMIEKNVKMSASAYAKTFGVTCTLLQNKTLFLDNKLMTNNASIEEIKNNYKYKFTFAEAKKINEVVENADQEAAYLVSLPYEKHTASPGSASSILCIRLVIDPKDGNILSNMGTAISESKTNIFLTQDFATCDTCK